ncbi:MAG: PEP/pyruvate-binding domain-containing protein [Candidatus Auribacterota bacterium]|jgi:phosphotransferase system HPr (HPr) family protein|nr:PEP/pyruvate-binding domain-containing protein [Candidatus Auribacterota bacterium]
MIQKKLLIKTLLVTALISATLPLFASKQVDEALRIFVPGQIGFSIPDHIGKVEDVSYGTLGKTVILVRDVHSHYSAQKSIADILRYLNTNYGVDSCFVEGFSGVMDLTPFTRYPDDSVRTDVSEKYLQNSKITGEEYFNIAVPGAMTIYGLEDEDLYEKNLDVFRKILTENSELYEYLETLRVSVIESALSQDERHLLQSWTDYVSLTGDADTFIKALDGLGADTGACAEKYPQIACYKRMSQIKNTIDMNSFQREHAAILSILQSDMPAFVVSSFKLLTGQFLTGRLPERSFFNVMAELTADPARAITEDKYPNFYRYMEFIELSLKLNAGILTREMYSFGIDSLSAGLCGEQCVAKFKAIYNIVYLSRILRCELTPDEAKELCEIPDENLHVLSDFLLSVKIPGVQPLPAEIIDNTMRQCKEHYVIAFERDSAMAQRIMSTARDGISICIAGGFHTTGMRRLLNDNGYTTVVIAPSMGNSIENGDIYRSIMLNKLDSFETLFARETSTLRQAALVWRHEHQMGMQLELLLQSINRITDPALLKPVLSRLVVESQTQTSQTEELLDSAVLYEHEGVIYIDLPSYSATLKVVPSGKNKSPLVELIEGVRQRVELQASRIDLKPVKQALGISVAPANSEIDPQKFALELYESIPIYDAGDYTRFLYSMKRALSHERLQDDFLRIMIFEAALDYVGYKQPDELTQQELAERFAEAESFLKFIYKKDFHRENFVKFLANYNKVNIRYSNYLMPLYISAYNVITNRALTSRDLIRSNHSLFHNAETVTSHPWYGMTQAKTLDESVKSKLVPEPLAGELLPDGKRRLRVLLIGAQENAGDKSPGKLLRSFINAVPSDMWDEIAIESRNTVFPETVYPFDPATGVPKNPETIFSFGEDGVYFDGQNNITYRKMNQGDRLYDPLAQDFVPQERFDLVIASDLGLAKFTDITAYQRSIDNLRKMLDDRGVLISGIGELGFADVTQASAGEFKDFFRAIPFSNMAARQRQIESLKSSVAYYSPGDHMIIQKAIDVRTRYQTHDNPAFDLLEYARFLALFGENPITISAFILQGVPVSEIRESFPDEADQLITAGKEFHVLTGTTRWNHVFPAVINLKPSDPTEWFMTESDEKAIERFKSTTDMPFVTLYDNGRYKFEIGYFRHNAVMFVTKYHEDMSSTKAFVVRNISAYADDTVQKSNFDLLANIVAATENIDFGNVPSRIPAIDALDTDEYAGHWNDRWVRPSPKHLRIAALFIENAATIKKEDILLFNGVVYSRKIADQFINHPLVSNNIKEGSRILTALYYFNPQLVSVLLRSMDSKYIPYMRLLIMQTLNEQIAAMINFSIKPAKGVGQFPAILIDQYFLLQLLAPSVSLDDVYRKNIGEVFKFLPDKTMVMLLDQLHSFVTEDFNEGWAVAPIAQIFHTEVPKDRKDSLLKALPKKKQVWLEAQKMKLDKPIMTISQIKSYVDGFISMSELIEDVRSTGIVDFSNPSITLEAVINRYKSLLQMDDQPLTSADTALIQSAVDDEKIFGMKPYNSGVTNLFMNIFNGWTHPEDGAFALEQIFYSKPSLARTIVRSIAGGKHHQMGSILFLMDRDIQTKIFSSEMEHISDSSLQRFMDIDGFAMFIMINFRYFVNENDELPQDEIVDVIDSFTPETLRNLFLHGYYFYTQNPGFAFMTRNFIAFLVDYAGEDTVNEMFAEKTEQNINLLNWIRQDIFEIGADDGQQIAQMLEEHPDYHKIRMATVTLENIAEHLERIMYFLNDTREEMIKGRIDVLDSMIASIDRSVEYFKNGYIYRGMREYGKAADMMSVMVDSSRQFSENIQFRLAYLLSHKIDATLSQYIAENSVARVKSLLPYDRNKVVGKLRFIPGTPEGVKLLFDQDYLNEGFAVVSQYPQNIASMAKPRAIIAEEGIGRDEHAAERAADWKIPYIIMPHARKLLAGLSKTGDEEIWVTIQLGARTTENVIRRATDEEIQEEYAYRMQIDSRQSESHRKVEPIKPDLSVRDIMALDKMGLDDNVHAGNKTARLGFMKNNKLPVKNGFVLPFGFYDRFAEETGIYDRIGDILSQPDFQERKIQYLSQIRDIILQTPFPSDQERAIADWYKTHLGSKPVIARSSTNAEDLPGYAGAGVYDSFPNLKNESELINGIKRVYASVWTERAYANRQMNGIEHTDVYPSVLVQEMSMARFSGVLNTANELSGSRTETTLSIDVGYGGGVDGMAAEFVYDRSKHTVIEEETDIPDTLAGTVVNDLSLKTFSEIDSMGMNVEALFGTPQKIEFSFDKDGYWVNQSKDLQTFRGDTGGQTGQTAGQHPLAEHTMTIPNRSGLYLKPARQLAQTAVAFMSSIQIVKLTGYGQKTPETLNIADAKEIMQLLELNLRQGDSIKIIAQGEDAHQALNTVSELIIGRFGEEPHPDDMEQSANSPYLFGQPQTPAFTVPDPEFFIVHVSNYYGLHARPTGAVFHTLQPFNAKVSGRKITVTQQENGIMREIYGDPFDMADMMSVMMQAMGKGTRVRIEATGADAQAAMKAVRELFENNLNDTPNPTEDIPLQTVINEGLLMELQEKQAVDAAIAQISRAIDSLPAGTAQGVVFDAYLSQIGYFTQTGFIPVDIGGQILAQVQKTLFREPTTGQYIINALAHKPGLAVHIFTAPMDDMPVADILPVEKTLKSADLAESSI